MNRRLRRTVSALLDTGSDVSAIPKTIRQELDLYPIGKYRIEGVGAGTESIYSYKVILLFDDFTSRPTEVIETPLTFAVIGRDVLKHFNFHLYGQQQMFELKIA